MKMPFARVYTIVKFIVIANLFTVMLCGCIASKKIQKPEKQQIAKKETQIQQEIKETKSKENKNDGNTLSPASELMIKTCDNYLSINPNTQKAAEVYIIKASLYYNNKRFNEARESYKTVIERFPKDPQSVESVRMIAQSYYEEKKFDEAQKWYRTLKEQAVDGTDKQDALARIAESIFKLGESYENQNEYKRAATEYERVALEFPDAKIAEASLFNAGLVYEKLAEWSQAILMYQKIVQKYISSKMLPKAYFRTAKCYEKLLQWNNAGETYLRVIANFPSSDLASVSVYNAGFCFENAGKLAVAAATFEKMAQLFPQSEDAADVLFRAGEIYGKVKDWPGVTRVNQEFTRRFGNDANRAIQALCMVGVAQYMQNRQLEALDQLNKAVALYGKLKNPSSTNKYYAAKADFTIGEINHEAMNAISLTLPKETYKRQLKSKSELLDNVITGYSRVIKYQISEWTTRSIFSIAKAYEDFAIGIFKQQRPTSSSIEERLALELGIAQAVEEYFVAKAAHYHEENVKLGIKEKIEDKYVLESRQKLTSLPFLAGTNYLALVEIAQSATTLQKLEGFALIAKKLEVLQRIGPFQERAIELFLACLQNGSKYQEIDEFYNKASSTLTKTSYTVGQTYADIAQTAREAPIPGTFDPYESFVYKTKLLKQIESYEDKSSENLLRTVKIAEAYKIEDDYVKQSRTALPRLLFIRGLCYDNLCITAFRNPPFPASTSDAEKEEYMARFEEIGLQFQENAFNEYKNILSLAKQNYGTGSYVTHAYVRLFQKFPKEYGRKIDIKEPRVLSSGPEWKCFTDTNESWASLEFNDSSWMQVQKASLPKTISMTGFPEKPPQPMWFGKGEPKSETYEPANGLAFRRIFYNYDVLTDAHLWMAAIDEYRVYVNGKLLESSTSDTCIWTKAKQWDLLGKLRDGKNVICAYVKNNIKMGFGFMPYLSYTVMTNTYVALPPQATEALDSKLVADGVWQFPSIVNFAAPSQSAQKAK